jgi:ABC-type uncharacterized transport system substrate-binding protein
MLGISRREIITRFGGAAAWPKAVVIGVLVNPNAPVAETQIGDLQAAANALGLRLHVLNVSSEGDANTTCQRNFLRSLTM